MNDSVPGATPHPEPTPSPQDDPVLARRERLRKFCDLGKRLGYSCFAAAMVLFFVALVLDFPAGLVTAIIACMVIGSIALPPAIVLGYGIKAADAEDRGEKFGY